MNLKNLLATILFLCSLISTQAQNATTQSKDSLKQIALKEIIITGNRINIPLKLNPAATSVVTLKDLQTMPRSIAADEALRLVPGVRIDNQANGSRLHMSIRGQGILSERGLRGIKVLIDGIPVNDPTGFAADLYDVDWEAVKQIEVLRGPAAAIYGGGSAAGVLNIQTADGGSKPIEGKISTTVGSNGFYKLFGQTDGTTSDLNYRVSFSHFQGDGYRDHTSFFGNNFSEKLKWNTPSRLKISQMITVSQYFNQNAEGLNIDQVAENPKQSNPDAIPCNEYQYTLRITNGFTGQYLINANQDITFNTYMRYTKYVEPGSSAVEHRSMITPGFTFQYNLKQNLAQGVNHFSVGTDIQWQTIDGYKLQNIKNPGRTETRGGFSQAVNEGSEMLANQTTNQSGVGIFAIDQLELNQKWSVVASLRYDNIHNKLNDKMDIPVKLSGSSNFDKLTGKIGTAYALNSNISLYANLGQGFMPPATEELMSNPVSFGGFNMSLKPATSTSEEVGIRGSIGNGFSYDLTGFYMKTKNDFYRYRILPARPLETFYGNAGSSNRFGIETYISYSPVESVNFKVAYTYSHFKYTSPDSIKGNWLPNSPQHQLNLDLGYKITKRLSIGISSETQSKWYIYTDEIHKDVSQAGFTLLDLRAVYNWKIGSVTGELNFFAKNITNQSYIAFTEPDPDGNSYQPASKREFFGGVKINF
jgi:iron complex outermembrane receptor protein